jgi:hypothetical protein
VLLPHKQAIALDRWRRGQEEYLNLWARELSNINHLPLVRYEGMRVQPEN